MNELRVFSIFGNDPPDERHADGVVLPSGKVVLETTAGVIMFYDNIELANADCESARIVWDFCTVNKNFP